MHDQDRVRVVMDYHERTKHHFQRFARSLGYMDWATQPDPFRRYGGAELLELPLPVDDDPTPFDSLLQADGLPARRLEIATVSLFLRYSLSITAWKEIPGSRWALRANPSSGNLHPTEGYLLLPALKGLFERPALYHYAPREHGLERRAELDAARWAEASAGLPEGSFLVGLSSIVWREAWKYGERAYRYTQHDVGHALAALRLAAAACGWRLVLLDELTGDALGKLLGLDRDQDFAEAEREEPDLLALVWPNGSRLGDDAEQRLVVSVTRNRPAAAWFGTANRLSAQHAADWPIHEQVATAARRTDADLKTPLSETTDGLPQRAELEPCWHPAHQRSAQQLILQRRSAVMMDGVTGIDRDPFFHILARLLPTREADAAPFDALPWRPRIHLLLFVHRVRELAPGLYILVRDPARLEFMRQSMRANPEFRWQRPEASPPALPFYLLLEGDAREVAAQLSCEQPIASHGVFAAAMLADYQAACETRGASFYPRLFWEAGVVGQQLYLEAERAGIRATGIGCYFDDPTHQLAGVDGRRLASFYHFTLGGPVEDTRLSTLPAYPAPQSS
jgi:SagB-type dehydrogenase family enzyme